MCSSKKRNMKGLKHLIFALTLLIFSICVKATGSSTDGAFSSNLLVSTQEKRLLNTCATFGYVSGNWRVGGVTGGATLVQQCTSNGCCKTGTGAVNANLECTEWNTALLYTICTGACQGSSACRYIAKFASGGSVKINQDACQALGACTSIGSGNGVTGNIEIEVGAGSCAISMACNNIGFHANSLTRIEVPPNECKEAAGSYAKCGGCGSQSTFDGTFQATDVCCAADGTFHNQGTREDVACNDASDIPSNIPSNQPSFIPSSSSSTSPTRPYVEPPSPCAHQKCNHAGKCEVTSTTDFKCICETTFINSADGRSCVCPTGFIRKSDNRCYDPTTPSPILLTKAPTSSPVIKTLESSSPSKAPTDENEGCKDDEDAEFYLIRNTSKSVKCSWLTKNKDRTDKRIANYCGLNRVKNICKSTCSFCTCADDDSFTFEMINLEKKQTCDWLTSNEKKSKIRIERYCTEKFDNGSVMNACTKSCGLCK